MLYLESDQTDPYYNLALEEYVFNELPKDNEYFMLWQNDNSIIIGKHQNTIEEINLPFVEEHKINVARRLSGGGAVYHDLGNLNYTFVTDAKAQGGIDLASFCIPVVKALNSIGVNAEISGRNDIVIDGRKFSGNAQYLRKKRVMHHGTLMFDSNLEVLTKALNVSADKVESKGIKSVRSRVTNIKEHLKTEMTTGDFQNILRQFMIKENNMETYELTEADKESVKELRKKYDAWDWNYGRSPTYSIRKERRIEGCGKIQLFMEVEKGVIKDFTSRGDYFSLDDSSDLVNKIAGVKNNKESLEKALSGVDIDRYFKGLSLEQFIDIILQ